MDGGFRHSPLKLNQGLSAHDKWNEQTIVARGNRLATDALDIWKVPILQKEILEAYRGEKTGDIDVSQYSINDHQYLAGGPTLELFNEIRKALLALDECVYEEFLKLYIAYKAETNFVDIVPQSKRLRVSLNIDYLEIDDPRNLCRDVTDLGRWGNGNVEVFVENSEDIPYIIGLARQALERQLGEEAAE